MTEWFSSDQINCIVVQHLDSSDMGPNILWAKNRGSIKVQFKRKKS